MVWLLWSAHQRSTKGLKCLQMIQIYAANKWFQLFLSFCVWDVPFCTFVSDCCRCYGKSCAGTIFHWCYGTPADANVSSILQDTAEQNLTRAGFFSAEIHYTSDMKFCVQFRDWNPHINCTIASHCSTSDFRCPAAGSSLFYTWRTERTRIVDRHQQASIATQVNRTLWSYFWWGEKW